MTEFNIKSTTVEKGLELAKDFLGKLFSQVIEELGGLMADPIKSYRQRKSMEVVLKAKALCEKYNIKVGEVPPKILVPFIEMASLEDDEDLQDKWANMLANMANSEVNLKNHVFPYILSQISIEEYEALKYLKGRELELTRMRNDLIEKDKNRVLSVFASEYHRLREEIEQLDQYGFEILVSGFERSNLVRLGLMKASPPAISIPEIDIRGQYDYDNEPRTHVEVIPSYYMEFEGYRITELGEKFLEICEAPQTH